MKKYSALDKYNIVSEGRSTNKQVAKVCEKHDISRETFYQWEARIKEAALLALENKMPGPKVALLNQGETDFKAKLEALEIENACLKLKQEWNEFQIELHGTEEQKRIIKAAKKRFQPEEKQWVLEKRIEHQKIPLRHFLAALGLKGPHLLRLRCKGKPGR